jgi:ABC-type dipeptide/oligopeptide/nickel transport system ATPase component
MSHDQQAILVVTDLRIAFGAGAHAARAVDGVSFTVHAREIAALVGESGCGKSVTALALARLVPQPPGHYTGGRILYRGRDILTMAESDLRRLRGGEIAYVFQEPGQSLNPCFASATRLRKPFACIGRMARHPERNTAAFEPGWFAGAGPDCARLSP